MSKVRKPAAGNAVANPDPDVVGFIDAINEGIEQMPLSDLAKARIGGKIITHLASLTEKYGENLDFPVADGVLDRFSKKARVYAIIGAMKVASEEGEK